jgi:hypothetical protein
VDCLSAEFVLGASHAVTGRLAAVGPKHVGIHRITDFVDAVVASPRERLSGNDIAETVARGAVLNCAASVFLCGEPVKPPRQACKSGNTNVTERYVTFTLKSVSESELNTQVTRLQREPG